MKFGGKPLFDPQLDPFARYRILGGALAVLLTYIVIDQLWRNSQQPVSRDFIAFWGAAKFAIAGKPALAYDPAILHKLQSAVAAFPDGRHLPFPYMPGFLLLMLPFGFLQYPAAMVVWLSLTLAAYLMALTRLVPGTGLLSLAFVPAFINCVVGQNGFLTAALFFAGIALLQSRPFVAGLLIGCLVIKPQFGILFPLALLAARQWRAIAGAAISSVSTTLAGLVAFGLSTFSAWLEALPYFADIAKNGTVGWIHLTSVYAAARQAGLGGGAALAVHGAVAAAGAFMGWRVWRSGHDAATKAAVLACATALSSSYIFLYDQVILIVPFLWLASRKANPFILTALWCLPMLSLWQYAAPVGAVNLGPLVPIVLLILVMRELEGLDRRHGKRKIGPGAEPLTVSQA